MRRKDDPVKDSLNRIEDRLTKLDEAVRGNGKLGLVAESHAQKKSLSRLWQIMIGLLGMIGTAAAAVVFGGKGQ